MKPVDREEERHGQQFPIVIVDDDESVRTALESLLKSMRLPAEGFASAEDFLHSTQVYDSACLILDVHMPGMDGLELQRQLAEHECRVPIIFITAYDDEDVRQQVLQAGAVDFLSKPFAEEDLLNAVHTALQEDGETT